MVQYCTTELNDIEWANVYSWIYKYSLNIKMVIYKSDLDVIQQRYLDNYCKTKSVGQKIDIETVQIKRTQLNEDSHANDNSIRSHRSLITDHRSLVKVRDDIERERKSVKERLTLIKELYDKKNRLPFIPNFLLLKQRIREIDVEVHITSYFPKIIIVRSYPEVLNVWKAEMKSVPYKICSDISPEPSSNDHLNYKHFSPTLPSYSCFTAHCNYLLHSYNQANVLRDIPQERHYQRIIRYFSAPFRSINISSSYFL